MPTQSNVEDSLLQMIEQQRVLLTIQGDVITHQIKEIRRLRSALYCRPRLSDDEIVNRAENEGLIAFVRSLLGPKV